MIVGVVLFVPFVAASYRRRGTLSAGRVLLWIAALVYFWAIWTYTLLPLPEPGSFDCVPPNFDLGTLAADLRTALAAQGNPLRTPQFLQLALNVLLFLPLGFFVRVLGGRGILVAGITGLLVSTLIETTQLTGAWGIYPCAYRMFDVVDIVTNTSGALIGSLFALIVPRAWRRTGALPGASLPRPVTRGRRFLGMISDGLAFALVQFTVNIGAVLAATNLMTLSPAETTRAGELAGIGSVAFASLLWVVVILSTGRSIGDLAVQLRYAGGRLPQPLARIMRALGGVTGYAILGALPAPGGLFALLFAGFSLVLLLTTRNGRGLPGLVSGQELRDSRESRGSGEGE
nr:VanZ family protein [Leucobacter edaphi]